MYVILTNAELKLYHAEEYFERDEETTEDGEFEAALPYREKHHAEQVAAHFAELTDDEFVVQEVLLEQVGRICLTFANDEDCGDGVPLRERVEAAMDACQVEEFAYSKDGDLSVTFMHGAGRDDADRFEMLTGCTAWRTFVVRD